MKSYKQFIEEKDEKVKDSTEFIRKPTKKEIGGGSARSKGFQKIPDKEGYEKVYKPYGYNGKGYYYIKIE